MSRWQGAYQNMTNVRNSIVLQCLNIAPGATKWIPLPESRGRRSRFHNFQFGPERSFWSLDDFRWPVLFPGKVLIWVQIWVIFTFKVRSRSHLGRVQRRRLRRQGRPPWGWSSASPGSGSIFTRHLLVVGRGGQHDQGDLLNDVLLHAHLCCSHHWYRWVYRPGAHIE